MLFAGDDNETTSVLIVSENERTESWLSASVACTVNEYVVLEPSTGAVPEIVPLELSVEPEGKEPEDIAYVIGASPVATTVVLIAVVSYTEPNEPADVVNVGTPEYTKPGTRIPVPPFALVTKMV